MAATPILRIDLDSALPVYLQIVSQLRAMLVSGKLAPGRRLPPVRQLANDLSVHHNTVAQAYRTLAGEGWLELRRGRGARVLARSEPKASAGTKTEFSRRLEGLVAKAASDGLDAAVIAREFQQVTQKLWKGKST